MALESPVPFDAGRLYEAFAGAKLDIAVGREGKARLVPLRLVLPEGRGISRVSTILIHARGAGADHAVWLDAPSGHPLASTRISLCAGALEAYGTSLASSATNVAEGTATWDGSVRHAVVRTSIPSMAIHVRARRHALVPGTADAHVLRYGWPRRSRTTILVDDIPYEDVDRYPLLDAICGLSPRPSAEAAAWWRSPAALPWADVMAGRSISPAANWEDMA